MKCSVCKNEIKNELDEIVLNADGDMACSTNCQKKYETDLNHFLKVTINDEKLFENYLKGK